MPFYAGKGGSMTIAGTAYPMDTWSVAYETDEVEVSNFQSSGQKSYIAGMLGGTVTTSGPYNGTAPTSGTIISVTCGLASGVNLPALQILVTSVTVDTTVKEKATIEVQGTIAANLG